jgi:hypothetical protein
MAKITGTQGNDIKIFGGSGKDALFGDLGNDLLQGGEGDDDISGSTTDSSRDEIDTLSGGLGSDHFSFGRSKTVYYSNGGDSDYAIITDFDSGTDKIWLVGWASDYMLAPSPEGLPEGTGIYWKPSQIDVFLLQDVTESFADERSIFQALAKDLIDDLKTTNLDTKFGLGSFADRPEHPYGLNRGYKYEIERVYGGYEYLYYTIDDQGRYGFEYTNPYGEDKIIYGEGYSYVYVPDLYADYRKIPIDEGNTYVYRTNQSLTDNDNLILSAMNSLPTKTQADEPEAQLDALVRAASSAGFRDDTTRFVVLSTDAPYHEGNPHSTVSQVKTALESNNVIPIFAVTSDIASTYQSLVAQLGVGAVVPLNTDSSGIIDLITQDKGELIGIIQGVSGLDLKADYFHYRG